VNLVREGEGEREGVGYDEEDILIAISHEQESTYFLRFSFGPSVERSLMMGSTCVELGWEGNSGG
jgi:hypothetical protein